MVLGILAAGYLLYHFRSNLHLNQFSGAKLWEAIRRANLGYLFLSIVGIYGCYALRALRWQKFQAHLGAANFGNIYRMTLAGFSALFILGRAAEPVRPLLISRKDKIPLSDIFGIYVLERILDAASTAVLAAVGLLIFESSGHLDAQGAGRAFEKGARTAGTFFALFAVVAISGLIYLRLHGSALLERRMQSWLTRHGWRAGVARNLLGFVRGVQTIRSWGDVAAAVIYSGLHWLLVAFVYLLVLQSFGEKLATLRFADAVLILVFSAVGSAVQLPGVGGGAQALSVVALTQLYGVEREPAVAAAMMLWLVTFASCSFAGVPLLIHEGWSIGELKRMREHEDEEIEAELAHHGEIPN
ncbi:MAG TPA: lysylphosphatidylglycerol synthase transmembrane domain-containing protein [Candidatus Acidoferrum sp.]|nr:lysylphosphatidylglycerol synthase transmembrane domain-containing protein [Candidatus Acidoferrum sp.]